MEAKPISLPTYNEIIEDTPIAVTTTVAKARLIGETRAYKWVLAYAVRVRSMGTATYIALGTDGGQEHRLTVAGQSIAYGCNRYEVIDMAKKYIKSDVAGAVVEVSCTFLPIRLYGKVNMADRA